ncbi:glycosyltransferase family 2 protein [Sporolactobacillus sp. THM7-7]|nr:glycosyltransferase family 2 protein [Sporolactobacillus sp. THM7-7]
MIHFKKNDRERIKISVVVPTYNTDPKSLERVLHSLDQQTMDPSSFETVFIDDGSTTDVFERLQAESRKRKNMIVKQIPNSGWGSRPRNVGTRLAKGEYILYLDHDDYVFPEAFERVYRFASESQADVVNAKEVRTKGWSWGWDPFKENRTSAEKMGIQSLLPMTPHKFYRRQFLLDHNITFNEGERVLWEDVYFNTKVFSCGAKVSILADYPCYHWVYTGTNNSSSFGRDPKEKWGQIRNLFHFFKTTISNEDDLTFMLRHWYRTRVLGNLGQWLLKHDSERDQLEFDFAKKIASEFVPADIDQTLYSVDQLRAFYLRNSDNVHDLKQIAEADKGLTARSYATDVRWQNGKVYLETKTEMSLNEKKAYLVSTEGNHYKRKVPLKESAPSDSLLSLDQEIDKMAYDISIKGRKTRETWRLHHDRWHAGPEPVSKTDAKITATQSIEIDIDDALFHKPLNDQPWDLAARFSAFGYTFHRGIVAPHGLSCPALINNRTALVYENQSRLLSLDIGSQAKNFIALAGPQQKDLYVQKKKWGKLQIDLFLTRVHVYGNTRINGKLELVPLSNEKKGSYSAKAQLIGDSKGARIHAVFLAVPIGRYRLVTHFEKKKVELDVYLIDRERLNIL